MRFILVQYLNFKKKDARLASIAFETTYPIRIIIRVHQIIMQCVSNYFGGQKNIKSYFKF